ncbi:hypothetical protein [Streptomyces sp. NBC_00091]|uniref:hypothetical protein n=1 Tax=Streptomyces sp. NBC_00091 TaxID=2975648 RepID=UPI00225A0301|nr:hypothetical protein [Streptomyces sp. NBC_00091]MCX5380280.1 hypothetical protein [Streptomyces sp. NBC_00091]
MESLPPLEPAQLDDGFGWLGGADGRRSEHTEHLAALERELAGAGLALPGDFAAFYGSEHLCRAFDEVSVTACWSHLSGPLHSPAEEGARLVRFFSHVELESAGLWAEGEPTEEVRAAVASSLMRCADTFLLGLGLRSRMCFELDRCGREGGLRLIRRPGTAATSAARAVPSPRPC